MFELLGVLFVVGMLILFGEFNKWEFRDVFMWIAVVLVIVFAYIMNTKKPTYPNSDGY